MNNDTAYLILTPAGVFDAFLYVKPDKKALALQALLSKRTSPKKSDWLERYGHQLYSELLENGLIEELAEPSVAPDMALDAFLPHVVASLSGSRRAAIASNEGFCLAKIGYSQEEADRLCAAAADFLDFVVRQEQRGLSLSGRALSLFNQVDLLLPEVSFVFLWIDDTGYVLILDDEPLVNSRAFVELVWAIKTSRLKFEHEETE